MSSLDDWFKVFKRISDDEKADREENIRIMAEFQPDRILKIPADPFYTVTLGFWSSPRGVIMIEANGRGEFDPRKAKFFSTSMINSLVITQEKQPNPKLRSLEIE